MAFIAFDPILGEVDLSAVDPSGPGRFDPFNQMSGGGRSSYFMEELRGYDLNLGAGVFQYAVAAAGIAPGVVVEFVPTLVNGRVVMTATPWAGAANSGRKLAVAISTPAAGQWAWFQTDGVAIVNVNAAPTVNGPAYFQAAGVITSTPTASKQAFGIVFATTSAVTVGQGTGATVLPATQALALLTRPIAQGAIT